MQHTHTPAHGWNLKSLFHKHDSMYSIMDGVLHHVTYKWLCNVYKWSIYVYRIVEYFTLPNTITGWFPSARKIWHKRVVDLLYAYILYIYLVYNIMLRICKYMSLCTRYSTHMECMNIFYNEMLSFPLPFVVHACIHTKQTNTNLSLYIHIIHVVLKHFVR